MTGPFGCLTQNLGVLISGYFASSTLKLSQEPKHKILSQAKLSHMRPDIKSKYLELLLKYHDILSLDEFELGKCCVGLHAMPLLDEHKAIFSKQFPLSIEQRIELIRQAKEWKRLGVIRECFVLRKKP